MSHKRVVKKRGKTYGPYLYESYRDKDGKVKKRYLGKASEKHSGNKILIGFLIFAFVLFFLVIGDLRLTGRSIVSIDEVGNDGSILTGKILFVLQQSELVPADTQVIINHGSFEKTYNLSDLVSDGTVEGDFLVEGKNINGTGTGYTTGSERFPAVNFVLGIYREIVSDSGQQPVENVTGNETSNETNQTSNETPVDAPSGGTRTIAGMVVSEDYELVEEISASTRYNESFTYDLDSDETADILSAEQSVALTIESSQAIVTTEYLGEDTKTLEIDVNELNISAENNDLIVSFVYSGTEIDSATKTIQLSTSEQANETLPSEPPSSPPPRSGIQAGEVNVSLISPDDYYSINNTNQNIDFNCSAVSVANLTNISLEIWNSTGSLIHINTSNASGSSNYSEFVYNATQQDIYQWNCFAYDNNSDFAEDTSNRTFIVHNGTGPVIGILNPENNSVKAVNNVTFIYYASSTVTASDLNCSLILDGGEVSNWATSQGRNWTYYNVADGNHTFKIMCLDNQSTPGTSEEYNIQVNSSITDSSNPSVQLRYPQNGRKWFYNPVNVSLMYNASDDYGDLNCTLYNNFTGSWQADGNHSNFAVSENETLNILFENLGLGGYLWNVLCTDSSGNSDFASSNYSFYIVERKACFCSNCSDCTTKFVDNECANVTQIADINWTPATNIEACINKTNVLDEIQREFIGGGYQIKSNTNGWGTGILLGSGEPVDIFLVIDSSGSMEGQKMTDAKNAANDFVDEVDLTDYDVGIVDFDSDAEIVQDLTSSSSQLHNAINALDAGGYTAIGDGINAALNGLENNNQSKAIILMSDGQHNTGSDPYAAALRAVEMNATIFTIGFGGDADETMLKEIAEITMGQYYFAPTGDALRQVYLDIIEDHIQISEHIIRDVNITRCNRDIEFNSVVDSEIINATLHEDYFATNFWQISITEGENITVRDSRPGYVRYSASSYGIIMNNNNTLISGDKTIQLTNSDNSTIYNNTGVELAISSSDNCNISYNDANGLVLSGFSFSISGDNNIVEYNNASGNTNLNGGGISIGSGKNISFKHNIMNNNGDTGFNLGANDSLFENNTANYNGEIGFNIAYQSTSFNELPSTFRNNTAIGNDRYSYWIDELSCDTDLDSSNVGGDTGKPILYFNHNNNGQLVEDSDAYSELYICNASDVIIDNITIYNPVYTSDGMVVMGAENATIRNSNSSSVYRSLYVEGRSEVAYGLNSNDLNATSNLFYDSQGASNIYSGIHLSGEAERAWLYNNTIKNAYAGIVFNQDNVTVIDNTIENTTSFGIWGGGENSWYSGNNISDPGSKGFSLATSNNATVFNNSVSHGASGAELFSVIINQGNFSNNYAFNSADKGFYFANGDNNVIQGNIANYSAEMGLHLTGDNNTLIDNEIYNSKQSGIHVASGSVCNITNNKIVNSSYTSTIYAYGGIHVSLDNTTVEKNNLTNITGYGIVVYLGTDYVNVSNNTVDNATDAGLYIRGANAANPVRYANFIENNVSNSGGRGIFMERYGVNNTFTRNIIENSSNYGIEIDSLGNGNNSFYDNIFNGSNNVDDESSGNYWNTTYNCSIENYTNIIGGNCSGGNYWSNYNGTDDGSGSYPNNFSNDGIGDTELPWKGTATIDVGGDYLPLSEGTNQVPVMNEVIINSSLGNNVTNESLTCYANASDAEGANVSYFGYWYLNGGQNISFNTIVNYSSGILVNVSTLDFGNTTRGQNWSCNVSAYDGSDNSSSSLSENLTILNLAPYFNPDLSNQSVSENSTLYYDINCSDTDNDILTYYINDSSEFSINASSGEINWTTDFNDAGNYSYLVSCGDDETNTSQVLNISVANVNQVSSVDNIFVNSSLGNNVTNETLTCYVNASDPDGDNLSYNGYWYLNGGQNISFNTIVNYTPGTLVNVSTLDFGNTSKGENWSCYARADDGIDNSSYLLSDNLTILNLAPYFNPDLANQTVAENSTLYYDINCSDTDNDLLTYYINDTSEFSIGSSDGIINWTPGFGDAGVYTYNVTCGDDEENASQTFIINVTEVNQAPVIEDVFVNSSLGNNVTNETLTCYVNSSDSDGNNVSYSGYWYKNGVENLSFSTAGDFYENTLVNVSTLDFGNTTKGENWTCNISASDGTDSSEYNISANLTILNLAPYFNPDLANQTVAENSTLYYDINCLDTDNDLLTYYINDSSEFVIGSSDGIINWTPDFNDAGVYLFNVSCGDDQENTSQIFNITVSNVNQIPVVNEVIINSSLGNNFTNESLTCYANASDADGDNLSYNCYWYKDGVQNISFNTLPDDYYSGSLVNVSTLDSSFTLVGENWSCNVSAYDGTNYSNNLSSVNLTILSNVTPLSVVISSPISTTYTTNTVNVLIEIDRSGYCEYSLDAGATNNTLSANGTDTGFNATLSGLSNGNYVLNAYCNDTSGIRNDTESVSFTINVDTGGGGNGGSGGCSDQCTAGDQEGNCINSTYLETRDCGNYDSDSCDEWSDWTAEACSSNEICDVDECIECDFNCSDWSECIDDERSRVCDSETCGIYGFIETESCTVCEEDWDCEWTACAPDDDYSYSYDCVDLNNCGTDDDKPDRQTCDEYYDDYDCSVRFNCTPWGECESVYSLDDLINEVDLTDGFQRRFCVDELNCAPDHEDRRACDLSVDVNANITEWCEEEYVEIYDKSSNKLVSRLREEDTEIGITNLSKIDISFMVTEFTGYCDYCYDGIMNFDETGIDCGGPSCPECVEEIDFFDWLFWLILFLWASIVIFTGTIVWQERVFIATYFRDRARGLGVGSIKGVERMAHHQRPEKYPRVYEKAKPGFKLSQLLRKRPRQPFYGTGKSEKGINVSRPKIEKRYNVKDVASHKERQAVKKQGFMNKVKNLFTREKTGSGVKSEKVKKVFKSASSKAQSNVSSTRSKLRRGL